MSLINKMLKDLETRQGGSGRGERPIFQDLHSTRGEARRGTGRWVAALALLVAGSAGIYSWTYWDAGKTSVASSPVPAANVAQVLPLVPETPAPAEVAQQSVPPESVAAKVKASVAKPRPTKARTTPVVKPQAEKTQVAESETGPVRMEKTERPYTADELAANAYREALQARNQGNPAEAERRLKTLLVAYPQHVQARELLGAMQVESGRWPLAQTTFEQGVTLVPAYAAFRYQLARLLLEHGNEANAVAVLERARADNIKDAELPAFLAALYQRSGRHDEAIKNYKEALAARSAEGKWWLGLGISLEAKQDSAAARDAYRRALDTGRLTASLASYAQDRLRVLIAR